MFGSSKDSEASSSILPNVFQEESACSKLCPNLTFNQRYQSITTFCFIIFLFLF